MSDAYQCPCCGGVSDLGSVKCQYCGTPFLPQGAGFGGSNKSLGQQVADLEALLIKTPNDAKLQYLLGETCHKAGEYDKAEQALEKAAALAPGDAKIPHLLAWNAGIKNGWECVKVGKYADRAVSLAPDFKPAQAMKLLNAAAQTYIFGNRGDFDLVLETLNKALALDPENTYIYMYAATVYEEALQRKDAIAVLKKAADLALKDIAPDKEDARVFARLGYLCYKDGQLDEAKKNLDKAIALDPTNATARQIERMME
jgi:tetratricopeptide (TPR) repeat protein